MKKHFVNILFCLVLIAISCTRKTEVGAPVELPGSILKNMMSFLTYREGNVRLSEDFTALNPESERISKEAFLKLLASGEYLPLRLISKDTSISYQLYKLGSPANPDIQLTLKSWGLQELSLYKREGTIFPPFKFVDLDGREYSNETTKGKILVLKCWYIGCSVCRKEMPALNKLVNQYKDRKDILFVSIAFDSKEALSAFLKKKTFIYAVVPDQKAYMDDVLKINMYPTHFIVNKKGIIVKAVNDEKALSLALQKEASK